MLGMALNPEDIIEAIVDELMVGDLAQDVSSIHVERKDPGSLLLDYGTHGRFTLTVTPELHPR